MGITGESHGGKITPYPHLTPYEEIDYPRQKMIGLNVKTKTMELQEENIGKYLCDLGTEKVSQHTKSTHHRRSFTICTMGGLDLVMSKVVSPVLQIVV